MYVKNLVAYNNKHPLPKIVVQKQIHTYYKIQIIQKFK